MEEQSTKEGDIEELKTERESQKKTPVEHLKSELMHSNLLFISYFETMISYAETKSVFGNLLDRQWKIGTLLGELKIRDNKDIFVQQIIKARKELIRNIAVVFQDSIDIEDKINSKESTVILKTQYDNDVNALESSWISNGINTMASYYGATTTSRDLLHKNQIEVLDSFIWICYAFMHDDYSKIFEYLVKLDTMDGEMIDIINNIIIEQEEQTK